jgi:small GTP-binding protein
VFLTPRLEPPKLVLSYLDHRAEKSLILKPFGNDHISEYSVHKLADMKAIKLVTLGDVGVGKTCLIKSWMSGDFEEIEKPTVAVDYHEREVLVNGARRVIRLWDTAGQERYKSLTLTYSRGAQCALVVFSVTDPLSFDHIPRWIGSLKEVLSVPFVLIGNKCDLEERKVFMADIQSLSLAREIMYFETSAKTGEGVNEAFEEILKMAAEVQDEEEGSIVVLSDPEYIEREPRKICCS